MMMTESDGQLLRRYAVKESDTDFEMVLRRHLDLVYGTAMRRLRDPYLAQEVTQNVFVSLAKKAGGFRPESQVAGWLHRAAVLEANHCLRTELRRRRREERAAEMGQENPNGENGSDDLIDLLDDGLLRLPDKNREALILRFFHEKSLRDVGQALGIGEDAAQKRVAKSVKLLANFFRRKGYAVSISALTVSFFQQASPAAPVAVETAVMESIRQGTTVSGSILTTGMQPISLSSMGKVPVFAICLAMVAIPAIVQWRVLDRLEDLNRDRRAQIRENERLLNEALASAQSNTELEPNETRTLAAITSQGDFHWDDDPNFVRIRKADLDSVRVNVLTRDLALTDEICQILAITDHERQSLDQTLADVSREFRSLEAEHTVETEEHPQGFHHQGAKRTFVVAPFPGKGQALQQSLLGTFTKTLGMERTGFLLKQAGRVVREGFSDFGSLEKIVSVAEPEQDPNHPFDPSDPPRYTVYVEFRKDGGMQQATSNRYEAGAIPAQLRPFVLTTP